MSASSPVRARGFIPLIALAVPLAMLPSGAPPAQASWTAQTQTRIHDVQGASHLSPLMGMPVANLSGIVTAKRNNGFYMQDPTPDADDATSEGIFVHTGSAPTVSVGDAVRVSGTVTEFRPGSSTGPGLTVTELTAPSVTVTSSGQPLPTPVVIGLGGRVPPAVVIRSDAPGDVETSATFDPGSNGLDFYESLEGMRVQVNNAVVVGPRNSAGEIVVLADDGANATVRTSRGGIVVRPNDFNPERIVLDDAVLRTPAVNVGDRFTGPIVGVLDYSRDNYRIQITEPLTAVAGGITPIATAPAGPNELAVATFNVQNLHPGDPPAKFTTLARLIVEHLAAPDILAVEEIQDNSGATKDGTVDASQTYSLLRAAIQAVGGPTYEVRQIDPLDGQDGGEPGGNIRVGFLFRTDRGLSFIDRPGGDATTATIVQPGPQLSLSPGRVDPTNHAFDNSRKPLAGEFSFQGHKLFVIANHFNSKGGDQPLFGRFQPPIHSSEVQRAHQAQVVHDFVGTILSHDPNANVVVLGDLNDFDFSTALNVLTGSILHDLMGTLPQSERYTYVFDGNSQALDHILVSANLFTSTPFAYEIAHVNAEFAVQASDHDPQVARFTLP
jgi:uncharacterized protein